MALKLTQADLEAHPELAKLLGEPIPTKGCNAGRDDEASSLLDIEKTIRARVQRRQAKYLEDTRSQPPPGYVVLPASAKAREPQALTPAQAWGIHIDKPFRELAIWAGYSIITIGIRYLGQRRENNE